MFNRIKEFIYNNLIDYKDIYIILLLPYILLHLIISNKIIAQISLSLYAINYIYMLINSYYNNNNNDDNNNNNNDYVNKEGNQNIHISGDYYKRFNTRFESMTIENIILMAFIGPIAEETFIWLLNKHLSEIFDDVKILSILAFSLIHLTNYKDFISLSSYFKLLAMFSIRYYFYSDNYLNMCIFHIINNSICVILLNINEKMIENKLKKENIILLPYK
jgi:hypothetical protein